MMEHALAGSSVAGLGLAGLVGANVLRDRGVAPYVSRALASFLGGAAFLLATLFMAPWPAVAVAAAMAGLVIIMRLLHRSGLRGTDGDRAGQRWSQVTYAVIGVTSLAVGWGLLGDPWLGFLPIAFVAWGDAAAGLARMTVWKDRILSAGPSLVMLGVCLATAMLFQPFWIGATGALVATAAERRRPKLGPLWDDNVNVFVASMGAMTLLTSLYSSGSMAS